MSNSPDIDHNNTHTLPRSTYLIGLIIGILAVSTGSIFIRFAQVEMPSLVIAAGRLTLATLIILPFAVHSWRMNKIVLSRKTLGLLILSGIFLGLHFITWVTSLEYTSVASSVVLVTTAPLWVALLSPIFLNEKITKWVLVGLGIALIGAILVGMGGSCSITGGQFICIGFERFLSGEHFTGNLLALLGAIFSGAYLMVGRSVRNRLSLPVYTTIVYGVASIVLILLVIISGEKITGYSTNMYWWVIGMALIPQVIGHTTFNWALKYLSAAYVSIALLGEPIGAVVLAALLLKEKPGVLEIIGGILILLGITLATQRSLYKKNPPV